MSEVAADTEDIWMGNRTKCVVCLEGRSNNRSLLRFPVNEERRKAWLDAIRLTRLVQDDAQYMYICSEHFDRSMLTDSGRIKSTIAMPKLPDNPLKYPTYRKLFTTHPKKFQSAFRGIDLTKLQPNETQGNPKPTINTKSSASKNNNQNRSIANKTTPIQMPTLTTHPPKLVPLISSPAAGQIIPPKKDECTLFCELLSNKLRTLTEEARVRIMDKIEELIFQATIHRKLELPAASISNHRSEQPPRIHNLSSSNASNHTYIQPPKVHSPAHHIKPVSTASTQNSQLIPTANHTPITAPKLQNSVVQIYLIPTALNPNPQPIPASVSTINTSRAPVVNKISPSSTSVSSIMKPNVMQMAITQTTTDTKQMNLTQNVNLSINVKDSVLISDDEASSVESDKTTDIAAVNKFAMVSTSKSDGTASIEFLKGSTVVKETTPIENADISSVKSETSSITDDAMEFYENLPIKFGAPTVEFSVVEEVFDSIMEADDF